MKKNIKIDLNDCFEIIWIFTFSSLMFSFLFFKVPDEFFHSSLENLAIFLPYNFLQNLTKCCIYNFCASRQIN